MADEIKVGQIVPEFKLDTFEPVKGDFGEFSIDSIKKQGKWTVLFFYPADFTFVCPTELADLADQYEKIKELGAELISISTDTKFTHLAWQREEKLLEKVRFPMGADPTGRVSRLFGVYDESTGLSLRGTFIINPDGKLVFGEVNFYPVGRNSEELLRLLSAHIHVSKNPNEACPAGWRQGGKTLKPSAKLVGKVYEALKK